MSEHTISVVASVRGDEDQELIDRGRFDVVKKFFAERVELSAEEMAKRLSAFLETMDGVLAQLPGTLGGFQIDEMELQVEISAKGQVSLLGTGGEVGASGGLSFKLKRKGNRD